MDGPLTIHRTDGRNVWQCVKFSNYISMPAMVGNERGSIDYVEWVTNTDSSSESYGKLTMNIIRWDLATNAWVELNGVEYKIEVLI